MILISRGDVRLPDAMAAVRGEHPVWRLTNPGRVVVSCRSKAAPDVIEVVSVSTAA